MAKFLGYGNDSGCFQARWDDGLCQEVIEDEGEGL